MFHRKLTFVSTAGLLALSTACGQTPDGTAVDGAVAVGKRVTVTDETGDDKVHRITVKLGG